MISKIKRTVKFLSSPKAISAVQVAIAIVTFFQALDAFKASSRKIGFTRDEESAE